jgi:uncharacterized protein
MTVAQQNKDQLFSEFAGRRYMLINTYRKDGTPVPTPVGAYMVGGRLYFLTDPLSGKAKRLRRNPHVTIAPCTMRGRAVGKTMHARVRAVSIEEAVALAESVAGDHPVTFHLARLLYDIRGKMMTFYELVPTAATRPVAA